MIDVTAMTIPLTKDAGTANASPTLSRSFFTHEGPVPVIYADALTPSFWVNNFRVNSAGDVTVGNGKGAGAADVVSGSNPGLTANTEYYLYAVDYNPRAGLWSNAYDITNNRVIVGRLGGGNGTWTLPKEVDITVPAVSSSTATTSSVDVADDTEVYWILVKEGSVILPTASEVENGTVSRGRTVVNAGSLSSGMGQTIDLHDLGTGVPVSFPGNYVFYYVVKGASSGKFTTVRGVSFEVPEAGTPAAPAYTVDADNVTTTMIPLTKDGRTADASSTLTRRFFVASSALTLTGAQRSGAEESAGVTTFTVNTSGDVVIGDGKGAGTNDVASGSNPTLTANTKYYLYATDYDTDTNKVSAAYDITSNKGAWTLPAAVMITVPAPVTPSVATTERVDVVPGTDVYWVLLEGARISDPTALTGADIEGAIKGRDLVGGRAVINKGRLVSAGKIALYAGAMLSAGDHVLYHVVKGEGSGLYSALRGVSFTLQAETGPVSIPAPTYTVGRVSHDSIVLTGGLDFGGGADTRRFYVSKNDLTGLTVSSVKDGASSGVADVRTFTLGTGALAEVTIGAGNPAGNEVLETGAQYYVRAIDYDSSGDRQSDLSEVWQGMTTSDDGFIRAPAYTAGAPTASTLPLVGGSPFSGMADRRRFYVSKNSLSLLDVTETNVVNGTTSGVSDVWTFTLSEGEIAAVTIGSGLPSANKKLETGTRYYVLAVDYKSSDGSKRSNVSADLGGTTATDGGSTISRPTYTVGTPRQTSIPLTGGSSFSGEANRRRFFVSKSNLSGLTVTNAVNGELSGVEGEVWTFTLSEGERIAAVTIGSGTPSANKRLEANVRYYVRAIDYKSDGSAKSELSADLGASTARVVPPPIPAPTYAKGTPTQTTLPLLGGSAFGAEADRRRFYVSKNNLSGLTVTNAANGESSGVADVWTFTLSAGEIATVTIGSGTPSENKALEADTRYYVRALDYRSSDGVKSALSDDLGGTTAKKVDSGTDPVWGTPEEATVYAYPNPTSGLLHVPVSEGVAVVYAPDGTRVGSFEVSAGQMDLSSLPAGTYVIRLSEHIFQIVKYQ